MSAPLCCYEGSISGGGILIKELKSIVNAESFLEKKRQLIVNFVRFVLPGGAALTGTIAILLHSLHNRRHGIAR